MLNKKPLPTYATCRINECFRDGSQLPPVTFPELQKKIGIRKGHVLHRTLFLYRFGQQTNLRLMLPLTHMIESEPLYHVYQQLIAGFVFSGLSSSHQYTIINRNHG